MTARIDPRATWRPGPAPDHPDPVMRDANPPPKPSRWETLVGIGACLLFIWFVVAVVAMGVEVFWRVGL